MRKHRELIDAMRKDVAADATAIGNWEEIDSYLGMSLEERWEQRRKEIEESAEERERSERLLPFPYHSLGVSQRAGSV